MVQSYLKTKIITNIPAFLCSERNRPTKKDPMKLKYIAYHILAVQSNANENLTSLTLPAAD